MKRRTPDVLIRAKGGGRVLNKSRDRFWGDFGPEIG